MVEIPMLCAGLVDKGVSDDIPIGGTSIGIGVNRYP